MASLAAACRASARLAGARAAARGLATTARSLAAHNFTMPALSPTMTEGNIAAWKVKEGEPFSAGDVLLEIETDKATMDVEAQDDGVMVRILAADGSKAVRVGSRIAVVAEPGDDVAALEMPADEQPQTPAQDSAPGPGAEFPEARRPQRAQGGETHEQRHPLMPAVEHLVKQHALTKDDVARIKPTGPNGRLLKGDVLAYLGTISPDSPIAVSSRLEKLSHLDLSNIKVAAAPARVPKKPAAPVEAPVAPALEVHVPISLAKVVEVQRRIQDKLGIFLPLSTFVSRAAEVANDDLPPVARAPTPSELFDQVLGLDKVKAAAWGSRGVYLPQISAVAPPAAAPSSSRSGSRPLPDIIDELAGARPRRNRPAPPTPTVPGVSSGANVFSLVVPREEQRRAQVFLERCKLILEKEPGRLVL